MSDFQDLLEYNWQTDATKKAIGNPFSILARLLSAGMVIKYKNHLPKILVKDFILGIQNLTNTIFFFKSDRTVDIISREDIYSGDAYDLDYHFLNNWQLGEKKDVTLKFIMEHDSDCTIFGERYTDLTDREDDILDPVADWTALEAVADPVFGDIRFLTSENIYCEYKWITKTEYDPDTEQDVSTDLLAWEQISVGFQPGIVNSGKDIKEEITTKFSSLFGDSSVTRQAGNLDSNKHSFANYSPRLIFPSGSYKQGSTALDWNGDNGLINKNWKYFAPFWANRLPVAGEFQLPLNILYYVINNLYTKFRTRHGEFIIDTMETEFKGNTIGVTNITGFKVE